MIGTERWQILPACLRAGGGALFLAAVVGGWAAAIGGCVREYPDDHWLPGVQCEAGVCLAERPDRRASTFTLARDCQETLESPGIVAQRMTLIDDGKVIVLAGIRRAEKDPAKNTARIAVARFDANGDGVGNCPVVEWPADPGLPRVAFGAHVVGPDGRFWSFVGDVAGTQGLMAYDAQSSWAGYSVASPSVPAPDGLDWNPPNPLAIALPGGAAILRSLSNNDAQPNALIPVALEWWRFGSDGTPTQVAQAQTASDLPGYNAVQSIRGQVRLFSVGNRLVVLGDPGRAWAYSAASSTPEWLVSRPADPGYDLPNQGSASVLLPLRPGSRYTPGSVLYIGGSPDKDIYRPAHRRRLDLFDPAGGTWTSGGALPRERDSATAVLLPDGRILLAGDSQGAREIFYIDPQRGFSVTISHDILGRTRGLGVGGLVVADGRVVLAGGNQPDGQGPRASPDVDVWEPPYLDASARAARPTIANVPGPIAIDGRFSIDMAPDSPPVTEVVLLAHSSSFMGNNLNQRLVQLEMAPDGNGPGSSTIALHGPPAGWAPAGRYLLFALGAGRIPSVGMPVDVVEGAAGP